MTAIEWYDEQLKEIDYKLQSGLINFTQCKVLMDEAKIQAKEMEKEQIIKAYIRGCEDGYYHESLEPEEYYNETFKSE